MTDKHLVFLLCQLEDIMSIIEIKAFLFEFEILKCPVGLTLVNTTGKIISNLFARRFMYTEMVSNSPNHF